MPAPNPELRKLIDEGVRLVLDTNCTKSEAARTVITKYKSKIDKDVMRSYISKKIKAGQTKPSNTGDNLLVQALENECAAEGIPMESVKHFWFKSKRFSVFVKGGEYDMVGAVQDILEQYKPSVKGIKLKSTESSIPKALKVTISDEHVGLESNKDGRGLFEYEYNPDIFYKNINHVIDSIRGEYELNGRFEVIYLDSLGDGLDGWDGQTTRGGHKLEQNLNNVDQFKVFVNGRLNLIEQVIAMNIADKVVIRAVTNCNHSGTFGELANITIKAILDRVYDKSSVEYVIITKFMQHFYWGSHAFILTHGKDKEHMKHGLPKELNHQAINFINSYISHYDIKSKAKYIHVEKGDLHCTNFNRTKDFDYRNFMSFGAPSGWVQTNFGDTYSGYSIQVLPKHSNQISHRDYIFEFDKSGTTKREEKYQIEKPQLWGDVLR